MIMEVAIHKHSFLPSVYMQLLMRSGALEYNREGKILDFIRNLCYYCFWGVINTPDDNRFLIP